MYDIYGSPVLLALIEQNPDKLEAVTKRFEEHVDFFKGLKDSYPPAVLALYAQKLVEKHRTPVKNISCGKGCSHCCHYRVDINEEEADLLMAYACEKELTIDKSLLYKQVGKSVKDFYEMPLEDSKCVFLDDKGECQVYEVRPLPCRNHLVQSDPTECIDINGTVTAVADFEVEVITAAFNYVGKNNRGSLAEMILAELPNYEEK